MEPTQLEPREAWSFLRKQPDLAALAAEAFRDARAAQNWFYSVHPQWGLLPIYVARTPEGAARVSAELAAILRARQS